MVTQTLNQQRGFILTRHQRTINGASLLEFWLVTESGPVKLVTPAQKDVFFIPHSERAAAEAQLTRFRIHYEYQDLELKTFELTPVSALYFAQPSSAYKAKQALESAGITRYEDDIRLTERFLMERFVYGSARFAGVPISHNGSSARSVAVTESNQEVVYPIFHNANLRPDYCVPEFKVLSLDIECSEYGELYAIGLVGQDFKQVIMIGAPQSGPDWITWVSNEKALLHTLIQSVWQYDPDIFIGWNVVNFDFRLLIKRAKLNRVPLTLGRDNQPIIWRNARNEVNQGYITIAGRTIVDGIDALKTATYHFDSFSLEFVSQALLGKGKKVEDVDNRMESIKHDFIHNKIKLAEYNLQDCQLVLDIFDKTKILQFLTLRSQLTGLALDRTGGSVAAFLNLYLPKLHRAGYVAPNRPEEGGLQSPGGYVMRSQPGLYRHVLVLDFKSLYPSIIRTFKIDPMGLIEGLKSPDDAIPGYKGALFSREHHFLPDIISALWQQRDEAKKQKDAARSQAIKILMNSFYGILGSGGCPFYDPRLASSITMRGHDIMKTTAQWIEEAGYKVIYGDTDSIFVWLDGPYDDHGATTIGKQLAEQINQKWNQLIKTEFNLACALEIEFETHFKRFLMPTIRGSKLGSKKRYAGLKSTPTGEVLIFKGLETVRSDWTSLAKSLQTTLYKMIFSDEDVSSFLRQFVVDTRAGKYDDQLIYRKRLRRPLKSYVKNVPQHVKAARMADEINQLQGRPLRYQNKGHISYIITTNGPEAVEYLSSPIDYHHYIEKQIRPIAEGILPFIDVSYDEIVNAQASFLS